MAWWDTAQRTPTLPYQPVPPPITGTSDQGVYGYGGTGQPRGADMVTRSAPDASGWITVSGGFSGQTYRYNPTTGKRQNHTWDMNTGVEGWGPETDNTNWGTDAGQPQPAPPQAPGPMGPPVGWAPQAPAQSVLSKAVAALKSGTPTRRGGVFGGLFGSFGSAIGGGARSLSSVMGGGALGAVGGAAVGGSAGSAMGGAIGGARALAQPIAQPMTAPTMGTNVPTMGDPAANRIPLFKAMSPPRQRGW